MLGHRWPLGVIDTQRLQKTSRVVSARTRINVSNARTMEIENKLKLLVDKDYVALLHEIQSSHERVADRKQRNAEKAALQKEKERETLVLKSQYRQTQLQFVNVAKEVKAGLERTIVLSWKDPNWVCACTETRNAYSRAISGNANAQAEHADVLSVCAMAWRLVSRDTRLHVFTFVCNFPNIINHLNFRASPHVINYQYHAFFPACSIARQVQ